MKLKNIINKFSKIKIISKITKIKNIKIKFLIIISIIFAFYILYKYIWIKKWNNNENSHYSNKYLLINRKNRITNDNHFFFVLDDYNDNIPEKVDLRLKCPPIYDQGQLGFCHINAVCFVYKYICLKNGKSFNPSRFFCEYNLIHLFRGGENKISIKNRIYKYNNQGAEILMDLNSILLYGICSENEYPYPNEKIITKNKNILKDIEILNKNIDKNVNLITNKYKSLELKKPTKEMYLNAQNHKVINIFKLDNYNINEIKKYLFYFGPVIFHFKYSQLIEHLPFQQKFDLKLFTEILNNDNFTNSEKKKINEIIEITKKNIIKKNNISSKEINNIIDSSSVMRKKINEYYKINNRKISKSLEKNYKRNDYRLHFPKKLIEKTEIFLKKNGLKIDEIKNKFMFLNETNSSINILKKMDQELNKKINKIIKNNNYNKDIQEFLLIMNSLNNGHIMTIVGYDDDNKDFIIANSWGDNWGDKGYFYMDYEFFKNNDILWGNQANDIFCLHNTTDGHI